MAMALHAVVFALAFWHLREPTAEPDPPQRAQLAVIYLRPPLAETSAPPHKAPPRWVDAPAPRPPPLPVPQVRPLADPATPHPAATMAAPPAPTAEEWAFASQYTLKNSKAYRYTWGQQVRSMMGTAVEGPDQGLVRFRVEIAPDGRLARLETLWATSPVAERLARQAIAALPRWPRTPSGKPLVFEKTIAFTPHASDGPPLYKDDCLPDPPAFNNPFAWDGQSIREPAGAKPIEPPDPQALEDCLKQLPQDSIEAESARDQRLMDQWGWRARHPGR